MCAWCKRSLGGERLQLALFRELAERAALELAHALGRQPGPVRDLAQRQRIAAADAEAQLDDLARARVEPVERAADRLLLERQCDLLERPGAVRGDERAQLGLPLLADRRLEADRDALRRAQLLDL